jgi:putative hydrolase of the HAD superfamily
VKRSVEAVLFDVGGVLVEVSGVDRLRGWTNPSHSDEDVWRLWLGSGTVRAFEAGAIEALDFAESLISELGLPVEPPELLDEFVRWIPGLLPGARELLDDLVAGVGRATLSNSNPLHWPRIMDDMGLRDRFDTHFVSHLTGRVKPDPEAFEHAVAGLGCRPGAVVFVDDNAINVDAARRLGIEAHRARGVAEARRILASYGLLRENHPAPVSTG